MDETTRERKQFKSILRKTRNKRRETMERTVSTCCVILYRWKENVWKAISQMTRIQKALIKMLMRFFNILSLFYLCTES